MASGNVTPTRDELLDELANEWAELDAVFILPPRLPGDIDFMQIMEHYKVSETGARHRMMQLVRAGEWEFVTVADPSSGQGKRKVIRKVG